MADNELAEKLKKQSERNEELTENATIKIFNPFTEFKELTRKDILNFQKQFKKYH